MTESRHTPGGPGRAWLWRMALRDSRGKRLLLLLFTASIVFGIGAIVAIHSLRENLQRIVDEQARALLGADAVLQVRRAPSPALERFMAALPGQVVREARFRSMAVFPATGEARFVQVRAIDGPLPFYGEMETAPAGPWPARQPGPGRAIVEESLLLPGDLGPGDRIELGSASFVIEAALTRMAGESEVTGFFAPRVYINLADLDATGLVQPGSMVRHRFSLAAGEVQLPALQRALAQARGGLLVDEGADLETVADRRRSIERILNNLLDFLNLIGFIALLLGGIGIAGAVSVYLQTKRDTIAILRCLGCPARQAFAIYLGQMLVFGLGGALGGAALGVGVQFLIPVLLGPFLPFVVEMRASAAAVATGLGFGWLVVMISSLLPLLAIRHISPLRAIRASVEPPRRAARDPLAWAAGAVLLLGVLGLTLLQARRPEYALAFTGALLAALGLLAVLAWALRAFLRRLRPAGAPYAYRLALSNLYRPNNRTLLLMVTLGMGVLLINTLLAVRGGLLAQVSVESAEDAANVILLDVQPDQKDGVADLLAGRGLAARDQLPIVTMRLGRLKGLPMRDWRGNPDSPVADWVYTWEFRNTWRDHVLDNATVVEGAFTGVHDGTEPFPVSLSENLARDLGAGIGDSITWDVQGVAVESVVGSVRRVRWQAGRQNFNVVFPVNSIEAAPVVYAVTTRTADRTATAELQRALTERFPNVSLIDLSLVLESLESVLDKAAFVIQFMAGFTVATGLVVLAGALLGSRYQRIQESVLLRTLGASAPFIRRMLSFEFLLLGAVAGLAGLLLSWAAVWALFRFVFAAPHVVDWGGAAASLAGIVLLTFLSGWLTSRGIASQPPLAILRRE